AMAHRRRRGKSRKVGCVRSWHGIGSKSRLMVENFWLVAQPKTATCLGATHFRASRWNLIRRLGARLAREQIPNRSAMLRAASETQERSKAPPVKRLESERGETPMGIALTVLFAEDETPIRDNVAQLPGAGGAFRAEATELRLSRHHTFDGSRASDQPERK